MNLKFPFLTIFNGASSFSLFVTHEPSSFLSSTPDWSVGDHMTLKCQQAVPNLFPSTIAHCGCSFISHPPSFAARQQALPLLVQPSLGFFAQTGYCFICAALPLDSNQTTVPVFVSATQFSRANKLFLSLTHFLCVSHSLKQTGSSSLYNRIKQACLLFTSPTLRW